MTANCIAAWKSIVLPDTDFVNYYRSLPFADPLQPNETLRQLSLLTVFIINYCSTNFVELHLGKSTKLKVPIFNNEHRVRN